MKNNWIRKFMAHVLILSMLLSIISYVPASTATFATNANGVTVTVRDTTASTEIDPVTSLPRPKWSINNNTAFRNDVNPTAKTVVQGDTYANISYSGTEASKLEYKIVNAPVNDSTSMPADGWTDIHLDGVTENTDVDTLHQGYLKRRSFDVTRFDNRSDEATWNDAEKVFKIPYAASEVIPTEASTSIATYGQYIDNIGARDRRFYANSVFVALNGISDMYPPRDTATTAKVINIATSVTYNNVRYAVIMNNTGPQTVTIGGNKYSITYSQTRNNSTVGEVSANVTIGWNVYPVNLTPHSVLRNANGTEYIVYEGVNKPVNKSGTLSYITIGNKNIYATDGTAVEYQEASKFWGYFKAPQAGDYYFGLVSDDGSAGDITVNGQTSTFSERFRVQGSTWTTTNRPVTLTEGSYYPLNLKYFNWGGGAFFRMYYSTSPFAGDPRSNPVRYAVDAYLYPSKSDAPGEYSETTFTGTNGVKLGTDPGNYYVLYRAKNANNEIKNAGCYGPFVVQGKAEVALSKTAVNASGAPITNINVDSPFKIKYSVTPSDIPWTAAFVDTSGRPLSSIKLTDVRIQDHLSPNFTLTTPLPSGLSLDSTTDKLIWTQSDVTYTLSADGRSYRAAPITYLLGVKSGLTPGITELSAAGESLMTYTDPCDAGKRSKVFPNASIEILAVNHAPTVTINSPQANALVDASNYGLKVNYTPTDADVDTMSSKVYISKNGGSFTEIQSKANPSVANNSSQEIILNKADVTPLTNGQAFQIKIVVTDSHGTEGSAILTLKNSQPDLAITDLSGDYLVGDSAPLIYHVTNSTPAGSVAPSRNIKFTTDLNAQENNAGILLSGLSGWTATSSPMNYAVGAANGTYDQSVTATFRVAKTYTINNNFTFTDINTGSAGNMTAVPFTFRVANGQFNISVVDADGKGIPNVSGTVVKGASSYAFTTGSDGKAVLTNGVNNVSLPSGAYTISITPSAGYVGTTTQQVKLDYSNASANVQFASTNHAPTFTVSGIKNNQVLDANSKLSFNITSVDQDSSDTLLDTTVMIDKGNTGVYTSLGKTEMTNGTLRALTFNNLNLSQDQKFTIKILVADKHGLYATQTIAMINQQPDLTVSISAKGYLVGDSDSLPYKVVDRYTAAFSNISLLTNLNSVKNSAGISTTGLGNNGWTTRTNALAHLVSGTDANGIVYNLPAQFNVAGQYVVDNQFEYDTDATKAVVVNAGTYNVDVQKGTFTVRATDPSGKALSAAAVIVTAADGKSYEFVTGANGDIVVQNGNNDKNGKVVNLPSGSYTIAVLMDGYTDASSTFALSYATNNSVIKVAMVSAGNPAIVLSLTNLSNGSDVYSIPNGISKGKLDFTVNRSVSSLTFDLDWEGTNPGIVLTGGTLYRTDIANATPVSFTVTGGEANSNASKVNIPAIAKGEYTAELIFKVGKNVSIQSYPIGLTGLSYNAGTAGTVTDMSQYAKSKVNVNVLKKPKIQ